FSKTIVATAYSSVGLSLSAVPAPWTSTGPAPASSSARCRSWSIRSWTTSMSRLRSLAGPSRRQSMPRISRPSSTLRSSLTAGLEGSICPAGTDWGIEVFDMPGGDDRAARVTRHRAVQQAGLGGGRGDRLLDQHVAAVVQRQQRVLDVQARRRRDSDDVDVLEQCLDVHVGPRPVRVG